MGKFKEFNELEVAIELNRERLSETKKLREERLAEINAEFDKLEAGYSEWLEEYFPKYQELARAVLQASEFKLIDVAGIVADIVSAFKGEEYFYQEATRIHYVGYEKTKTTQVLDVVVAGDSAALEYSPTELDLLIRCGKMLVLADNHIDNAKFNFYESDEEGNLKFTTRFDSFDFVSNFFKDVIAKRADVRPDIPYTYEFLDKLKHEYLFFNVDKISDSYIGINRKDEEEYDRSIQASKNKLNGKKEFRAKQLAKIREVKPIVSGNNTDTE